MIKKIFWFLIFIITFIWSSIISTEAKDYEYKNLEVTANILEDWTINVNEEYTADFFVDKHWIIRNINKNYNVDWADFHIELSNINVSWKNFITTENDWEVSIKIWDANISVIWEQLYDISYNVYWLIRNFSWMWYAELYRNIVGSKFDTNFNNFSAELNLPKAYTWFKDDDFILSVNDTKYNAKNFPWEVDYSNWDKIIIKYDKWLPAKHGLKLSIKFPNDYFVFNHERQGSLLWKIKEVKHRDWHILGFHLIRDNDWYHFEINTDEIWGYVAFFAFLWIIFLLMVLINYINHIINRIRRKISAKRDSIVWKLTWKYADKYPVIVQYNPPEWISSAIAWALLHRKARPIHMISLVYKRLDAWLISIKIKEKKHFYETKKLLIKKLKKIPDDTPNYEKNFFNRFVSFKEREISSGLNFFNFKLEKLESYCKKNWWLEDKKYSAETLRSWALLIAVLAFVGLIIFWNIENLALYILFFTISIMIICLVSKILWRKTLKLTESWAELVSHILWYREFLKLCDEDKLKHYLSKDSLFYDKILSYAVVFGLETELIKKLAPLAENFDKLWVGSFDLKTLSDVSYIMSNSSYTTSQPSHYSWWGSSYSSSSWFSSWSSFSSSSSSSSWWWGDWWWSSW